MLVRAASERNFKVAQHSNRKSLEIVSSSDLHKKGAFDAFINDIFSQLEPTLISAATTGATQVKIVDVNSSTNYCYKNKSYSIADLIQSMGTKYLDTIINIKLKGYGFKIKRYYKKRKGIYQIAVCWN